METGKKKLLIVSDDLEYNRTSCGLLNCKMTSVLAPHFETHLLVVGKLDHSMKEVGLAGYRQFEFHYPLFWRLLGKIPVLRSLPEWFTGINHASYHKWMQWKKALKTALADTSYDLVLFLGSGMGWYAHMAYTCLPAYPGVVGISIHDPFPMALLPQPYTAPMDHGQRSLIRRMNRLIDRVQGCYTPSQRLLEHLTPYYPNLPAKCSVVPHLAYQLPFLANPVHENGPVPFPELETLHTSHQFLLVHLGSLLEGRSPAPFFSAMLRLLEKYPEATAVTKVVFIGQVHANLQRDFEAVSHHPNFIIATRQRISYARAMQLQQRATANLVIESTKFHSPQLFGKFADSVWANRPIISLGPVTSEARRLLGPEYPYQAGTASDVDIFNVLESLYLRWKQQPDLTFNRPDLQEWFHPDQLVKVVKSWLD